MYRPTEITITVDIRNLAGCSDTTLAQYWHISQANPARTGDVHAGELVRKLGFEIIRRWMATTPTEMYRHQADHYHSTELTKVAKYIPGCRDSHVSSRWHDGEWVPNAEHAKRKAQVEAAWADAATPSADDMAPYIGKAIAVVGKQIVASADDWSSVATYLRENRIDADCVMTVSGTSVELQRQHEAEQRAAEGQQS